MFGPHAAQLRDVRAIEQIGAPAKKAREGGVDPPQFRQGVTQSFGAGVGPALVGRNPGRAQKAARP